MTRLTPLVVVVVLVAFLSLTNHFQTVCLEDYRNLIGKTHDVQIVSETSHDFTVNLFLSSKATPVSFSRNHTYPDIGLQALIENGHPLEPVSPVLPQRLFIIYGLESSGTTVTAKTIASAFDMNPNEKGDIMVSKDKKVQVHHISLPWGMVAPGRWGYDTQYTKPLPMIPVFYPKPCLIRGKNKMPPLEMPPPVECQSFMGAKAMTPPFRFFVNMTTNIQWYRERGVKVYPIMVVRDPLLHFQGITKTRGGHAPNAKAAYQQYEMGRAIMVETIEKGVHPVLVSYETMLTLKGEYLHQLFEQLSIKTNVYNTTKFMNGNTKYLDSPHPHVEMELMKEDGSLLSQAAVNQYRPPNPALRKSGYTLRSKLVPGAHVGETMKVTRQGAIANRVRYQAGFQRVRESRTRIQQKIASN